MCISLDDVRFAPFSSMRVNVLGVSDVPEGEWGRSICEPKKSAKRRARDAPHLTEPVPRARSQELRQGEGGSNEGDVSEQTGVPCQRQRRRWERPTERTVRAIETMARGRGSSGEEEGLG